jgi:uncharacterized membrane protein (UPF0136 family)
MTKEQKVITVRWALVPIGATFGLIAAFFVSIPMSRFIRLILWRSGHPMPGKVFLAYTLPYDGALAASLVLLFGCFAAPAHRQAVAFVLLVLGGLVAWKWVGAFYSPIYYADGPHRIWWPIIGTYLGGLVTFAILCVRYRTTKLA